MTFSTPFINTRSGSFTSDSTPNFTGTAEAGSTVELFADGRSLGITTTDSEGNWSFTVPDSGALAEGSIEIAAVNTEDPILKSILKSPSSPGRTTEEWKNKYAFAALKANGSVVTWGNQRNGGDSSSISTQLSANVSQIYSNEFAFAAHKSDGSVVTWGSQRNGGDSSSVGTKLTSDVKKIFSTSSAFAALKTDGSVVTWGRDIGGGDSSDVSDQLKSDISKIFSTGSAFAALKTDGSVVTWGSQVNGGDSSNVSKQLSSDYFEYILIDTPSAIDSTDSSLIAQNRGNLIFMVSLNRINRFIQNQAIVRVSNTCGNVLGIVTNNSKPTISNSNNIAAYSDLDSIDQNGSQQFTGNPDEVYMSSNPINKIRFHLASAVRQFLIFLDN